MALSGLNFIESIHNWFVKIKIWHAGNCRCASYGWASIYFYELDEQITMSWLSPRMYENLINSCQDYTTNNVQSLKSVCDAIVCLRLIWKHKCKNSIHCNSHIKQDFRVSSSTKLFTNCTSKASEINQGLGQLIKLNCSAAPGGTRSFPNIHHPARKADKLCW